MKRALAIFWICLFLSGCGLVREYDGAGTSMGTVVTTHVYGDEDVTDEVMALLHDLEYEELSRRIDTSQVARMNQNAGQSEGILLSDALFEDISLLLKVAADSDGAFDCTLGAVSDLWNMDERAGAVFNKEDYVLQNGSYYLLNGELLIPGEDVLATVLAKSGYEKVRIEDGVLSTKEGILLDLGAVGKGIACDRILTLLEEKKVKGAVISVGGSILTYGKKPDGAAFSVAVTDPFSEKSYAGILTIEGTCFISTSGDYERYMEVDGKRYHHILNPKTGYPVDNGIKSVTIVCDKGILSDALSTACFVLGEEKGMELAKAYGAEALFIKADKSMIMTDGMRQIFTAY